MATKSIYKTVKIANKEVGRSLLEAINSSRKFSEQVQMPTVSPRRIDKKDIKNFFGKTVK